jgi:hypothetical protein
VSVTDGILKIGGDKGGSIVTNARCASSVKEQRKGDMRHFRWRKCDTSPVSFSLAVLLYTAFPFSG